MATASADAETQARAAAEQAARDAVNTGGMPNMNQEQLAWFENLMTKMLTAAIHTTAGLSRQQQPRGGKGHAHASAVAAPMQYYTDAKSTGKLDSLNKDASNWMYFSTKIESHVRAHDPDLADLLEDAELTHKATDLELKEESQRVGADHL